MNTSSGFRFRDQKLSHSHVLELLRKVNTSSVFRFRDQKLSYSHVLELLRKVLPAIQRHLNDNEYSLHTMRSGKASLAATVGVPDRPSLQQGSWISVSFKNRYVRKSEAYLLGLSRVFKL